MGRCFSIFFVGLSLLCSAITSAEKFDVVVGLSKPPYVLEAMSSGYEIDLVRFLLEQIGKEPRFVYVPFGRSNKMLQLAGIDALMTANNQLITDARLLSNPYIVYQNVAISLKSKKLAIKTIADLANFSVLSFQNADKVLGNAFANAMANNQRYNQIADQRRQPDLLFRDKVDVLIMDINIFNYFARQSEFFDELDNVKVHYIFEPSHYSLAFKEPANVHLFNKALDELLSSSFYENLQNKYQLSQPLTPKTAHE